MKKATTILGDLINRLDLSQSEFSRRSGISHQEVNNLLNGTGNGGLSFARLEKIAKKHGYAIGVVLHPESGSLISNALQHAREAAIEARHVLEYLEAITPELSEKLALLDDFIDRLEHRKS